MAEKADSSTSVCGSLRTQVGVYRTLNYSTDHIKLILLNVSRYLVASLVPKVQYLTGILSLSALRETSTSVRVQNPVC